MTSTVIAPLPTALAEPPDSEESPMSSQGSPHVMPEPDPPAWLDHPGAAGTYRMTTDTGTFRVVTWREDEDGLPVKPESPAPVPRRAPSIEDLPAGGVVSQAAADFVDDFLADWHRRKDLPYPPEEIPIPEPASGRCSQPISVLWPDGTVLANASCSLDPGHLEPHTALDRDGRDVLAPLDTEAVI